MPYIYTEADASGDSPANPHEEARAASVARNFVGACHFKMTGSKRGFRPGTTSGCMCACLYMHIIYCRMLFPGSLLACEDAHVGIPPDPDAANAAVAGLPFSVLKARFMQPCVEDSAEAEGNKAKKAVHSIGCIGSIKFVLPSALHAGLPEATCRGRCRGSQNDSCSVLVS